MFYDPTKMFEVIVNVGSNFVIHYFNRMRTGIYEDAPGAPILVQKDQPLYKLMQRFCKETVWKKLQYQVGEPY